ncbi:GPP34 family phosphoprotein [Streptomyces sp. NBC_00536]|uniref:GOLPH3/VPS74 family protein n=1 Tax=Streptomyces sp. NBC_00536 TaxID=2975769 RepID=UPI002E8232AF|nr:GPP34 family phosphoprotein [Streptomyces sp. NBC_00536]WUC77401.1 GPP34 family phosphoprotein [Streptomyces sp. NBC_00536]
MTTPRDLLIVAMDMETGRPVEQGELSLALAGAEVIDLLAAQAVRLDGDHIVPGYQPALADRLLGEAAGALVRTEPYEPVADWLWRRGRGLSAAYRAELEAEGQLVRPRRRGISFRAGESELVDSPARRQAADRWASDEPVLSSLAEAVGVLPRDARTADSPPPDVTDDAVATVLATVGDALVELAAVRQRRSIEDAAFDNIWRGSGG